MLEALQNPLVIAIVVAVLLLLIAIPVLVRRRRAGREEVLPPPELGQAIDYTSIPYEEPNSWSDRFARASPATKLLLVLVPLVLIVGGAVLVLTFLRSPSTTTDQTPTAPAAEITKVTANVAGPTKILVDAETTLPDGATVTAGLKEDDHDFLWYIPQTASGRASGGRVRLTMEKLRDAPTPKQGQKYTVVLSTTVDGQTISSDPVNLSVPSVYQAQFYQLVAAAPTTAPTSAPMTAPTTAPTSAPTTAPTTAPEATATTTVTLTAPVFNGGNIRSAPNLNGNVLGQLHAGEVVKLLERTADGAWYRVEAPEATGWVSRTLLTVAPDVARLVKQPTPTPTNLMATVFNGGNVRERPVTGRPLDQINAGETVQLLEKTSDGAWYRITNVRNVTGWVSSTLLRIAADVARQVPIAR